MIEEWEEALANGKMVGKMVVDVMHLVAYRMIY